MGSRFLKPETTILKISGGDTLTVKRRLNTGEQREAFASMSVSSADGLLKANPLEVGRAMVVAYLVDWSLTDDAGAIVAIRGESQETVRGALDALDPDSFAEIREAIDAHDTAMAKERAALKNGKDGANESPAISPSPDAVTGESNGSENSTLTTTTS